MAIYDNPEWLKSRYEETGNLTTIARECGVSLQTIIRKMKKFGLPYKSTTEKGYKTRNAEGYVMVMCKGHPGGTGHGYVYEHRLVMEKHLGRLLEQSEHVHHINENKADNRLENLALVSHSEHQTNHHLGIREKRTVASVKDILQLRSEGMLAKEIAKQVGLCSVTVVRVLNEHPIVCGQCGKTFKQQKALGMHIRRSHRGYDG